jgi:hypothetical protein
MSGGKRLGPCRVRDCTGIISSKLNNTRKILKNWSKKTSRIVMWIDSCNLVLNLLHGLEEQRPLFTRIQL